MNVETLTQQLQSMGTDEAPEPRPSFVTELETELRRSTALLPVPVAPRRDRQWGRGRGPVFPAFAFAATLLVLVAVIVVRPGGSQPELRVGTAVDKSGVLAPDPAPKVAVPSTVPTTKPPATTVPTTKVAPVPTTTRTTTAPKPVPTTEPAPTTVKTEPVVTGTKDPDPSTKPDPRTTAPVALKLDSIVWNGGAKLRWSAYQGPDFAAYLVLRATAPDEPVYPVVPPTVQVGRPITDPAMTRFWDQVDNPEGQAYRVVAVDRDGRLLGMSPVVRPAVPERKTTDTTAKTADPAA